MKRRPRIVRNIESVGIRLAPHVQSGVLRQQSRSLAVAPRAPRPTPRASASSSRSTGVGTWSSIRSRRSARQGKTTRHSGAAIEILDLAKSRSVTSVYTSLLGNKAALSEETPHRRSRPSPTPGCT